MTVSEEKTDLSEIVRILRAAGYRGYLPLETLGEREPRIKVPKSLDEVRKALSAHVRDVVKLPNHTE